MFMLGRGATFPHGCFCRQRAMIGRLAAMLSDESEFTKH
ncbi:hypothetical protein B4113_3364 [Geobacillus sp. B4113_201601]|nr:hypothetical protein B4113_3364 [Geobacillus sp. B4113_201601]